METKILENCRLCLKENEHLIDIFSAQGISLNIATILTHHFWFEPKEDDNYSNQICTTCWWKIENFHIFYIHIYNAHNELCLKLEENVKIEILEDNQNIQKECNDKKQIPSVTYEVETVGTELKLKLLESKEQGLETEIDNVDFNEVKIKSSDHLDSLSDSCSYRNDEDQYEEIDYNEHDKLSEQIKETRTVKKTQDEIEQIQIENSQIREYFAMECDLCSTNFHVFQNVKNHYKVVHKLNGYLTCCGKKFFKRCLVLEHIQRHLNPEAFRCKICNKNYTDKRGLQNHMNQHLPSDEKPYKCQKCPKSFAKNFLLRQHQIRHITEEEKTFFCDECGKSFASNSILQSHKRAVHEGAYIHVCEICAKSFKSKLFYENHMKSVHSDIKVPKVQCQQCGTWLKHEHSLRSHMARHADATKQHICNICGKHSPNRGALRSHQQYVHMIERTHQCSICDKAFKKPVGLREHMTMHTGERLYTCPHCPRTFNSSANLHSHRKKMHIKEWQLNRRNKTINISDSAL